MSTPAQSATLKRKPLQPNIDPAEVEKFDDKNMDWWNPKGPAKPLHQLNPHRLAYIKENTNLSDKSLLDIGCGGGILSEALAKAGANVTAIDMNPHALEAAKKHAEEQQLKIHYQQASAEQYLQNCDQKFDVITCMELLEHVPDPCQLVKDCSKLLKPEGVIFFSTVNRNPKAYFLAILGAEYILRLLPRGTHHYDKFIKPSELACWLRKAKLSLQNLRGISYQPLTGAFSLSDDTDVNYLVCANAE